MVDLCERAESDGVADEPVGRSGRGSTQPLEKLGDGQVEPGGGFHVHPVPPAREYDLARPWDLAKKVANPRKVRPTAITDPKTAQPVISGYLVEAGIGSGTAAGTATGPHGEIYDRLTIQDFQPASGSTDPHTSNLFVDDVSLQACP